MNKNIKWIDEHMEGQIGDKTITVKCKLES